MNVCSQRGKPSWVKRSRRKRSCRKVVNVLGHQLLICVSDISGSRSLHPLRRLVLTTLVKTLTPANTLYMVCVCVLYMVCVCVSSTWYVCVCVCLHSHVCLCEYVCACVCNCMCVCMHLCECVLYIYIYDRISLCECVFLSILMCLYVCLYVYVWCGYARVA